MSTSQSYSPAAAVDLDYTETYWCVGGVALLRRESINAGVTTIVWLNVDGTVATPTGPNIAAATPGACSSATVPTTANTATPTRTAQTTNAPTAAGLQSVSVTNVGTADGVVAGAPLKPGETAEFTAYLDPVTNVYKRLPAIVVDGSAVGCLLHVSVMV